MLSAIIISLDEKFRDNTRKLGSKPCCALKSVSLGQLRVRDLLATIARWFNCGGTPFLRTSPLYDTSPSNSLHDFVKLGKTMLQLIDREVLR
jgi:hypothetical protein